MTQETAAFSLFAPDGSYAMQISSDGSVTFDWAAVRSSAQADRPPQPSDHVAVFFCRALLAAFEEGKKAKTGS